jgi:hypothetical protein
VEAHIIANALLDCSNVKDVCFSVDKEFWKGTSCYDSLTDRTAGKFTQWLNVADRRLRILWDDGEVDTQLTLQILLHPSAGMKLEPYEDGREPPRPKRLAGERREQDAGEEEIEEMGKEAVVLKVKKGARIIEQKWTYETPESITTDARTGQRHPPKINRERADYKSPYLMWLNVALPFGFVKTLWGDDGWMNERLSGKDNSFQNKKTTIGEGLRFYGYMYAIANNPGRPVKEMWYVKEM